MIIFGIVQAMLFICQCCCWIPLRNTPQQGDFDKDKKKDKKNKKSSKKDPSQPSSLETQDAKSNTPQTLLLTSIDNNIKQMK